MSKHTYNNNCNFYFVKFNYNFLNITDNEIFNVGNARITGCHYTNDGKKSLFKTIIINTIIITSIIIITMSLIVIILATLSKKL